MSAQVGRGVALALSLALSLCLTARPASAQRDLSADRSAWLQRALVCAQTIERTRYNEHVLSTLGGSSGEISVSDQHRVTTARRELDDLNRGARVAPAECAQTLTAALQEARARGDWPRAELELIFARHRALTPPDPYHTSYELTPREYLQYPQLNEEIDAVPSSQELRAALKGELCAELKRMFEREEGISAELSLQVDGDVLGPDAKCKRPGAAYDELKEAAAEQLSWLREQEDQELSARVRQGLIDTPYRRQEEPVALDERLAAHKRAARGRKREARARIARWLSEGRAAPARRRVTSEEYTLDLSPPWGEWSVKEVTSGSPQVRVEKVMAMMSIEGESESVGASARLKVAPGAPLLLTVEVKGPFLGIFRATYTCALSVSAQALRSLRWRGLSRQKVRCEPCVGSAVKVRYDLYREVTLVEEEGERR